MRVAPPLSFVICTLIWGTTWLAIKIGYAGLDAVWGASLRFLLAAALMAPLVIARRLSPPFGPRQVGVVAFVGIVLFGLDYGLIYWGEQWVSSGVTAVLFATCPLFVALFAAGLIPHERVTGRHLVGTLAAIVGLGFIFWDELTATRPRIGPSLAIIGAAVAAGISSVVVRRWGRDLAPLVLNTGAMLVGGVALLLASALLGETQELPQSAPAWTSLLYLVLFGSVIAFLLYWDLLSQWSANRSILVVLLTPLVALIAGTVYGEVLTPTQWFGSVIVLVGVAVTLTAPHAPAPVAARA